MEDVGYEDRVFQPSKPLIEFGFGRKAKGEKYQLREKEFPDVDEIIEPAASIDCIADKAAKTKEEGTKGGKTEHQPRDAIDSFAGIFAINEEGDQKEQRRAGQIDDRDDDGRVQTSPPLREIRRFSW
jgi:hypothetical protein